MHACLKTAGKPCSYKLVCFGLLDVCCLAAWILVEQAAILPDKSSICCWVDVKDLSSRVLRSRACCFLHIADGCKQASRSSGLYH